MKRFEWDEKKRSLNLEKHSIDFTDAVDIFDDYDRVEIECIRQGEKRYQTIGSVNGFILFVAYTYRGNKIRVISARKASKIERKIYDEAKG